MILQSLVKYYEIMAEDEQSGIPKPGYSMAAVAYALVLSKEGELLDVLPLKDKIGKGGKEIARKMLVPEQVKKTSGMSSNFLCENSGYMLGIDKKGKPERSKECFECLKELHNKILAGVDCDEARAVVAFVNSWEPDKAAEHAALKNCLDDITDGGNLVFRLDGGGFVHQHPVIRQAWEHYKAAPSETAVMRCLVSGEEETIARLHPSIKGVRGAQGTGASIVSFNARAYESYGRLEGQGLNAPVSEKATFAYTTVLNHMLSDSAHKLFLGDSTVVFWAESSKPVYQDMASLFFDPGELEERKQTNDGFVRDERAVREVKAIFSKIANGSPIGDYSAAFDANTAFYALGIAPNVSRLAIRFFVRDSFGGFVEKVSRHYEDMRIQKQYPNEPDILSVWRLLNETVSPKASDKSASPLLAGAVMRSILTGLPYPSQLYNAVLTRIRAGDEINYCKASIIKAFLLRNKKNKNKEELTLALNENSTNTAYLLGRLFAVLEKAQQDANSGINTTIKDRYFSSACATPASIFPILLRLSQHHIAKAEYGKTSDKRIEKIMQALEIENNPFPAHLSLDAQGIFILGYYQQRNALWAKKDTNNSNEEGK